MIIAHNEALNLPWCLRSLRGWTRRVFVVDSGSTDGTQEIARSFGAEVVHHDWEGYARQKNWGLANLPFEAPWILLLDADESISDRLRRRLEQITGRDPADVPHNGFFVNRLTYFMGRPIRHCGFFPNYNLRLFKRGTGRFEERDVHEHVIIDDPVGCIREPMLHDDRRGLEHYFAKHNRYSTLEARTLFEEIRGGRAALSGREAANISLQTRHRRWVKRWIMPYAPLPGLWRFLYMYVARLGVLDGLAGLNFCRFIAMYDRMVALKLRELRRGTAIAGAESGGGLAAPEGSLPVFATAPQPAPAGGDGSPPIQTQPDPSPWSFKEKVRRAIWMIVGRPVFRASFHNWHRFRRVWLRLFGASVGPGVAIRPSAHIEVPWHLEIHEDATVGDHAILYSLGRIRIGKRSIISQYAHLCAGTHDYSDHTFRLIRSPITIGDDVWIGADAFIGPGVTVGSLSVVGARSSAYKDLDERQVYVGNPARPVKERVLR